jgi:hypothetical protein
MKLYYFISGMIFSLVAAAHLLRLIIDLPSTKLSVIFPISVNNEHWKYDITKEKVNNQWPVVLGPWPVPMFMSWVGLMIATCLSIWAFRLIR